LRLRSTLVSAIFTGSMLDRRFTTLTQTTHHINKSYGIGPDSRYWYTSFFSLRSHKSSNTVFFVFKYGYCQSLFPCLQIKSLNL
jgi:hypothetical protein